MVSRASSARWRSIKYSDDRVFDIAKREFFLSLALSFDLSLSCYLSLFLCRLPFSVSLSVSLSFSLTLCLALVCLSLVFAHSLARSLFSVSLSLRSERENETGFVWSTVLFATRLCIVHILDDGCANASVRVCTMCMYVYTRVCMCARVYLCLKIYF